VETLTRPPQTPVQPRSIADRPRHWPKRLLAIVIVIALLAVAGAITWLLNVEPFGRGAVGYAIDEPALHVTRRNVDALGANGSIQVLLMRRGMHFTYRFSFRNDAPVPVTIVGLPGVGDGDIQIRLVAAKPDLEAGQGPMEGFGPFSPFSIPSGTEAGLEVRVHVATDACYAPHTFASIWQLPVTYRIAGVTRHGSIDTGTEIRLEGNHDTAC
jgi:hypothetical protein